MSFSIVIATYGEDVWEALAHGRALPSAQAQDADEILIGHSPEAEYVSEVRNALARKATSEWLIFLDADDELGPDFVSQMQRALERQLPGDGPDVLLTPAVVQVRKGKQTSAPFFYSQRPLDQGNCLVLGTAVTKRLFDEVGGFGDYSHGYEDWSLWAKCWKAGAQIVRVPDAHYIQHINPDSKRRLQWRDHLWQVETHERVRKELFPV